MNGKAKSAAKDQAKYQAFLKEAAARVDSWPDWKRGDRPHRANASGSPKSQPRERANRRTSR